MPKLSGHREALRAGVAVAASAVWIRVGSIEHASHVDAVIALRKLQQRGASGARRDGAHPHGTIDLLRVPPDQMAPLSSLSFLVLPGFPRQLYYLSQ